MISPCPPDSAHSRTFGRYPNHSGRTIPGVVSVTVTKSTTVPRAAASGVIPSPASASRPRAASSSPRTGVGPYRSVTACPASFSTFRAASSSSAGTRSRPSARRSPWPQARIPLSIRSASSSTRGPTYPVDSSAERR